MRWTSALSTERDTAAAVAEAVAAVRRDLGGDRPDLVCLFASMDHAARFEVLPAEISTAFPGAAVVGCSGGGVIGGGREIEGSAALSLTAARLPEVEVVPWHLEAEADLHREGALTGAVSGLSGSSATTPHFVVLADPFSINAERLVRRLDEAYPHARKIGGLASGGTRPGQSALFAASECRRSGAVGVAFAGNLLVDPLVAQGCRPVGEPLTVTRCERNVIIELDEKRPVDVIAALYESLDENDRQLLRQALFIGIEMNPDRVDYREDELLVRNLVGLDPETGVLAVGTIVREWQIVRFLLRDAAAAHEDLSRQLARYRAGLDGDPPGKPRPAGALLFSCLGRGVGLFGEEDHDGNLMRRHLGDLPLGGFFCNGEIGPVGGLTFVHGYTSAFGFFRARHAT
jgi:small ligand-binding sensory domain FIST